ncbi:MAG: UDP-N-acetylmuramoyl-tripeptide--D-alanyl-D-alanine ligase [Spirochaetales bacterium]
MKGIPLERIERWLRRFGALSEEPVVIGTPLAREVEGAAVDSRRARPGSLFVALPGERTDGHNFVDHAVQNGAVAAIVHDERVPMLRRTVFGSVTLYPVDDPLATMQSLAQVWRKQFPNVKRVGITGSNGKTTTKEMLTAVLSQIGKTMHTRGNYNSDIGLPMELLRLRSGHEFAVLEMGMNRPGEIALLASLGEPDIAVITNIGTAHIGMIGSQEGIAREKKEIFSQFTGKQVALIPAKDQFADFLSDSVNGRVVRYSRTSAGITDVVLEGVRGSKIQTEQGTIRLRLPGRQMIDNAAAVMSVANELSIPFEAVKAGLESVRPVFGRAEVFHGEITVIQDCYNANPESMHAALDLLHETPAKGRRIAVLGAMKELGDATAEAHAALARRAASLEFDEVHLVGDEFFDALSKGESAPVSMGAAIYRYEEWDRVVAALSSVAPGDIVLLKGSRSVALERLTPRLVSREELV